VADTRIRPGVGSANGIVTDVSGWPTALPVNGNFFDGSRRHAEATQRIIAAGRRGTGEELLVEEHRYDGVAVVAQVRTN